MDAAAPIRSPDAVSRRSSKALLVLFLWLLLVLLAALTNNPSNAAGQFFLFGETLISIAAILTMAVKGSRRAVQGLVAAVYLLLLATPPGFDTLLAANRGIVLDLLLMLMLLTPAAVDFWTWQLQLAAGLFTLALLVVQGNAASAPGLAESAVLLSVTTGLSSILAFTRGNEHASLDTLLDLPPERERTALLRLPIQVWHVFVLQAALVTTLILKDVASGWTQLHGPLAARVYGLLVIVLGASLAAFRRADCLCRTVALSTWALGTILSLSRVASDDLSAAATLGSWPVLPLIALFWTIAIVPWSVWRHIALLWALVAGDLAIRMFHVLGSNVGDGAQVSELLHLYRAEYGLLGCGSALSLFVALAVRKVQLRHLAHYLDQPGSAVQEAAATRMLPSGRYPVFGAVDREAVDRLLFGLFCLGIVSCAVTSKILLDHMSQSLGPIFSWVMFLTFWGALVLQVQSRSAWTPVWGVGALLSLLLFLWPTLIVAREQAPEYLWVFWVGGLLFGVALIPWRLRELVPLCLVISTIAAELSHRLSLSGTEFGCLTLAAAAAVCCSVRTRYALLERCLFRSVTESLLCCETEGGVVELFARMVRDLFSASAVLFPDTRGSLLMYSGAGLRTVPAESSRLSEVVQQQLLGESAEEAKGMRLFRWLPQGIPGLPAEALPVEIHHGIVFTELASVPTSTAALSAVPLPVVAVLAIPPYALWLRRRLAIAGFCRDACALRIASLREARDAKGIADGAEQQAAQREYELGTLVHDINNTVQDMTLLCESILERFDPDEAQTPSVEKEHEVVASVERLAAIARSVATVVSDAKRRKELERLEDLTPRELVEVNSVVTDLVSFARLRAERKRITVQDPRLSSEPVFVRISVREHLETILRNLLNNALLYSPPGGMIVVEVAAGDESVGISVTDMGFGLTEEECSQVFLPGFRGKSASATPGGLGLGLAESQRVARAAGGEITATSAGVNQGATFTLRLPRQRRPQSGRVTSSWALLVDDQPSFTDFYAKIARSLRMQPVVASSVDEAIGWIDDRGRPSLVVTDIHLGTSDGLDLVRHLRKQFGTELPILVISGLASEDMSQQVRVAGATDFVAKPIGMRALYARVQSLLV